MGSDVVRNKIIITATFTAEPINESLSFLLQEIGNDSTVEFTAHSQVFQQLLDPRSVTRRNPRGVNVFLIRFQDWTGFENAGGNGNLQQVFENLERSVAEFIDAVKVASLHAAAPLLIVICPSSGNARSIKKLAALFDRMDGLICLELNQVNSVYVVSKNTFTSQYLPTDYDDPVADQLGHIPYTQIFYTTLGARIARMVYAIQAAPRKVIVLDCDQTLWLGICGEDGPVGIELDDSRRALQQFMVEQHDWGRLLCLCSKNNEEDVFGVFSQRPEMPLRLDHFVAWRINWKPKSENLRALAAELNLGLDSFMFVDDDPVICAEVEANCPEVLTLQLPACAGHILPFLKNIWAFDSLRQTPEDRERSRFYREASLRERLRKESRSLADFLQDLDMRIEICSLEKSDIPRIAQLTQRTNQFNFTTVRCSESQILQLSKHGTEFLAVKLRDRFGDYGVVGVVGFEQAGKCLQVKTFLLSCRAFGRGVEHRMLARLGELCSDRKLDYVDLHYRKSEQNTPATEFLQGLQIAEKRTSEDEQVFRVFAQYALQVNPNGDFQTQLTSSPVRPNGHHGTAQCAVSRATALNTIALELSEPEQILHAIRLKNKFSITEDAVAPTDEIEAVLKTVWESVLGVTGIGINDAFFDVGGDSIKAVRVFSEIERRFGRCLPLVTILRATTIVQLASRLREPDSRDSWSSLVPLQPLGSRPPLYCVHAAGGSVLFYRDLIKYLGPDQPLYGLQARGMNRGQTTHDSVEEMAAYYVAAMRAHQPEGPYYLSGSSFGGLVAFEMARQLERAGEQVALLALLDTHGPDYLQSAKARSIFLSSIWRCVDHVNLVRENLSLMNTAKRVGYLSKRVKKVRKGVQRQFLWRTNDFARRLSSATGGALPRDLQDNHKAIEQAQKNYKPKPYGGSVTLFRASRQPSGIVPDPALGWKDLCFGLEIYEVRGFHGAVTVEPHAAFLAEQLVPCLRRAQHAARKESRPFGRLPSSAVNERIPVVETTA